MNKHIEALLTEREGYLKRGLVERVEAVDEALRGLGFDNKSLPDIENASISVESEKATRKKSKKRAK